MDERTTSDDEDALDELIASDPFFGAGLDDDDEDDLSEQDNAADDDEPIEAPLAEKLERIDELLGLAPPQQDEEDHEQEEATT
jgi:hypothetical protein